MSKPESSHRDRAATSELPAPLRLKPRPPDKPHLFFQRGKRYPRAIAWLGFKSFWGHLWHLAASVAATQDIDSRDWMQATPPDVLTKRIADLLDAEGAGATLTGMLEDDLWIDYLADTGDDSDVAGAVAEMIFRSYQVPTGEPPMTLPRGQLLIFGGDTAYPVATDLEIHNRVCVPFNRVLRERRDGRPRVLMGIPGNHDWYDGLDGFGRMFRAREGTVDRAKLEGEGVDEAGQIGALMHWVEAFRAGDNVTKRAALPLVGYETVQNASYFVLRLAPDLDLWGVDRQLRKLDYTQRNFFMRQRAEAPQRGLALMLPDPAFTMLEPYAVGQQTMKSLNIAFDKDEPFVMSGDTHHFCRQKLGRAMHIIAGGGGAFLHPARINRRGFDPPAAEFPGPRACFALALQVPWQIVHGRAGFMVHVAVALLYLPVLAIHLAGYAVTGASIAVGAITAVVCAFIAGWRERKKIAITAVASLCGGWIGALPYLVRQLVGWGAAGHLTELGQALAAYLLSIYGATLGFGTFLMMLTLLGLEQHHAFSALSCPGYKHFLRLRIRRDGSAIDGFVIGKVDPLDDDCEAVLVDHFSWRNPRSGATGSDEAGG